MNYDWKCIRLRKTIVGLNSQKAGQKYLHFTIAFNPKVFDNFIQNGIIDVIPSFSLDVRFLDGTMSFSMGLC